MSLLRKILPKINSFSSVTENEKEKENLYRRWMRRRQKAPKVAANTNDKHQLNKNWISSNSLKSSASQQGSNRKIRFDDEELDEATKRIKSKHPTLNINKNPKKYWKQLDGICDGAFGKVYKAKNRFSDEFSAIKMFEKCNEEELDEYLVEAEVLKECKHKNIVKLYDAFYYETKLWVNFLKIIYNLK